MDIDKEEVLNELLSFQKHGGRNCDGGLSEVLEKFLVCVAKTGDIMYPWSKIKPVIIKKFELVVEKFNTKYPCDNSPVLPNVRPFNFQEMKSEIIERLESFYGAPFTIQRICELLTSPSQHYHWCDKFLRGLEKNVRVVSTVEARRPDSESPSSIFSKEYSRVAFRSPSNDLSTPPLPSSSSSCSNGLDDKEGLSSCSPSCSTSNLNSSQLACPPMQDHGPMPNSPAPLQQLDSFTTVFASPPSTPLAVVSDIQTYDSGSPSSSSSSSSDSSPQPSTSPPPLNDSNHSNDDSDFEDARTVSEEQPFEDTKGGDDLKSEDNLTKEKDFQQEASEKEVPKDTDKIPEEISMGATNVSEAKDSKEAIPQESENIQDDEFDVESIDQINEPLPTKQPEIEPDHVSSEAKSPDSQAVTDITAPNDSEESEINVGKNSEDESEVAAKMSPMDEDKSNDDISSSESKSDEANVQPLIVAETETEPTKTDQEAEIPKEAQKESSTSTIEEVSTISHLSLAEQTNSPKQASGEKESLSSSPSKVDNSSFSTSESH